MGRTLKIDYNTIQKLMRCSGASLVAMLLPFLKSIRQEYSDSSDIGLHESYSTQTWKTLKIYLILCQQSKIR